MRQLAAVLILVSLFALLVGSRFARSDGDHLAAISHIAANRIQTALPSTERLAVPLNAIKNELPTRMVDRVKARLESDRKLDGIPIQVICDGGTVTLRGIVPDELTHQRAVELTQTTTGVEHVIDELIIPESNH